MCLFCRPSGKAIINLTPEEKEPKTLGSLHRIDSWKIHLLHFKCHASMNEYYQKHQNKGFFSALKINLDQFVCYFICKVLPAARHCAKSLQNDSFGE